MKEFLCLLLRIISVIVFVVAILLAIIGVVLIVVGIICGLIGFVLALGPTVPAVWVCVVLFLACEAVGTLHLIMAYLGLLLSAVFGFLAQLVCGSKE
jgi:hypothetical protein